MQVTDTVADSFDQSTSFDNRTVAARLRTVIVLDRSRAAAVDYYTRRSCNPLI